jgi:hypothetical protein
MCGIGLPEIIITGAWYIRWERRQFTHGENLPPTHRSAMSIGVLVTNYWRAKEKPRERKKKEAWHRPPEGTIKINVDFSYDADLGKGGMGVIARDNSGKSIMANCKEL